MKVQRGVTREREDARGEAICERYARLSETDPARLAFKAMGRTTALITLPNAKNCRSPQELVGDFVTLFGTADPELLEHEGKAFTAGGRRYTVDVHGHSLSVYSGTGSRRTIAHDVIVRKIADIMGFAGLPGVAVEDANVFKCCIDSTARRRRYLQQLGSHTTGHGIRPDLSVPRHPFARSSVGPSQHQLYDVKTIGRTPTYHTPYRVQPADQRARAVPGEYRRSAIQCDRTWNGTPPGTVGTFEAYLNSLPPVIGLGFGGYGEWSKEVDSLIGQLAEIASAVPERLGCCHGPAQAQGQYAQWARKHLHRESLREVSRCRHAALDRLLLRPTETFAGDPDHCRMMDDSPNDPGVANAWDSSDARGAYEDRPPRAA